MTLHRIHRVQTLAVSLGEAWEYFSDPANLASITPPDLRFRVTCPEPEPMYAARSCPCHHAGHRSLREQAFFVQRLGPYRFWHHQHALPEDGPVHYWAKLAPVSCSWVTDAVWDHPCS